MLSLIRVRYAFLGLLLVSALTACGTSSGQSSASAKKMCDAFPPKDITIVVPFSAGGGYDSWARAIAPFFSNALGDDINVKVENLPGGGAMRGVNTVYSAKPDGSSLLFIEPGEIITNEVAGNVPTGFDIEDFVFLGDVTKDPQVFFVGADSNINSLHDLENAKLTMATQQIKPQEVILFEELGADVSYILHDASSDVILSLQRNDADISRLSLASVAPHISSGDVKPIGVMSEGEINPKQPLADELRDIDTLETIDATELSPIFDYRRVLAAPPETPKCIAEKLEKAREVVVNDPEFIEKMDDAELVVDPHSADDDISVISKAKEITMKYKDAVKDALNKN